MNNIILAINNEKIYEELKEEENINIISNNIQYKEGILDILEKNKNINFIILNENLPGEIKLEELLLKINKINNKIKIIIILKKQNFNKEKIINKNINKNKIIFLNENILNKNIILKKLKTQEKIVCVFGARGTGKTITTLLLSEIISKSSKVLIVEDDIKNKEIIQLYKNKKNEEILTIKNNLDILNINKLLENEKQNSEKIIKKIKLLKNNYDYIFIDLQNLYNYKKYKKIIKKNLLILNPNILEINKIKKIKFKNKKIKIILNNYNENSISEKIIKNIFCNNYKIIGKLKNNKNYNLIINNNMNTIFLDKKTRMELNKIIENL